MRTGHEADARTARQQRNPRVNAQNFQRCLRVREKSGRHEDETERHWPVAKLRSQLLRPRAQAVLVKAVRPVGGGGKIIVHTSILMPIGAIANFLRKKRILFRCDLSVMLLTDGFNRPNQIRAG